MDKSCDQAFIKLGTAVKGNLVYINHKKFIPLFSISHILISGVNIGHSIFVSDNFRGPIEEKSLHCINSYNNFIKILFSDEVLL